MRISAANVICYDNKSLVSLRSEVYGKLLTIFYLGTPVRPEFRNTRSGPGIGEVTLQVLTSASGVTKPVHGFAFVITPVLEGQMLNEIIRSSQLYQRKRRDHCSQWADGGQSVHLQRFGHEHVWRV